MVRLLLKHMPYFFAHRKTGVLGELVKAVEREDQAAVDALTSKAEAQGNAAMSAKELAQAAEAQHSQTGRAVQELVQNSKDAYEAGGGKRGADGRFLMEARFDERGRNFAYRDLAGGMGAEDLLSRLFTVGVTRKHEGAVGGHGQGFKSAFGIARETIVASRGLRVAVTRQGGEYVADFSRPAERVDGVSIALRGVEKTIDPIQSLRDYCWGVDSEKFNLVHVKADGSREKLNAHGFTFETRSPQLPGVRVRVGATSGNQVLQFTQSGLHIRRSVSCGSNVAFWFDLPAGKGKLQMRGRDVVPKPVYAAATRPGTLRQLEGEYARHLLEGLRAGKLITGPELSVLCRRRALESFKGLGKGAALFAGAAMAGLLALKAQGLVSGSGASAAGLAHVMNTAPVARTAASGAALEVSSNLLQSAVISGASALGVGATGNILYDWLADRADAGQSVTVKGLAADACAAARELVANRRLVHTLPIIPVRNPNEPESRVSLREARGLWRKRRLAFVDDVDYAVARVDGSKTIVHNDYRPVVAGDEYGDRHSFLDGLKQRLDEAAERRGVKRAQRLPGMRAFESVVHEAAEFARGKTGASKPASVVFSGVNPHLVAFSRGVVYVNPLAEGAKPVAQSLEQGKLHAAVLANVVSAAAEASQPRGALLPRHREVWRELREDQAVARMGVSRAIADAGELEERLKQKHSITVV